MLGQHANVDDISGRRFGRLLAVRPLPDRVGRRVVWLCNCDCGSEHEALGNSLKSGGTSSCGCLRREQLIARKWVFPLVERHCLQCGNAFTARAVRAKYCTRKCYEKARNASTKNVAEVRSCATCASDFWTAASRNIYCSARCRMDRRSPEAAQYRKKYNSKRWQILRKMRLASEPLCRMCVTDGGATVASVVDHITPHRGSDELFFDYGNTQSLCKAHHDGAKQREERHGYSTAVGLDGLPTDPRHPWNRT